MNDLYLKKLRLKNFCNYIDHTFDFTDKNGEPFPFVCFFGPNGIGKSTILEAISLLSNPQVGRPVQFIKNSLRKYIRSDDYDPAFSNIKRSGYMGDFASGEQEDEVEMLIEGTYVLENKEYIISMTQNGWTRNDFEDGPWGKDHIKYRQRIAHFVSSDSDLSLNKFQLHLDHKDAFEKIVEKITRFPAKCIMPSDMTDLDVEFCTDFIIIKKTQDNKEHKIHFKRMSAGEKKICKSFSDLLNKMHALTNPADRDDPVMEGWPRLLLLDNIVMHIYYDRHVEMIDTIKEVFNKQQIFATTHSGILIPRHLDGKNNSENELYIDIEPINGHS